MELKEFLKKESAMELSDSVIEQLWAYKNFLQEYNEKVNLTAITDDAGIVTKHFLDCLTIAPYIAENAKIIDVGTGAGLPGIVLKIARPDLDVTLLDARGKKVKFLAEAVELLDLKGVTCVHARAEDEFVKNFEVYDYVVSRAVAAMEQLSLWCLPFVKAYGKFIAMKGPNYEDELADAQAVIKTLGGKVVDIKEIALPDDITRNVIIIDKIKTSPRKMPKKK